MLFPCICKPLYDIIGAHALRELLETKDCLLIMGHKIGDIDCFGAAIGMYRIASALNKKAHIVINEVTSSVRPMMERFETGDYPKDLFLTGRPQEASHMTALSPQNRRLPPHSATGRPFCNAAHLR